jgi:hypothetical protein
VRSDPGAVVRAPSFRKPDEPTRDELLDRVDAIGCGEAGYALAAARHHELRSLLDAIQVLAQPIMELANTHFALAPM